MKKIVFILMLVLAVSCSGQEKKTENSFSVTNDSIPFNEDFPFLIGKWKEVEYRGNNGAENFTTKIKNGRIFTFQKDGSIIIEKEDVQYKGTYEVHSDKYDKKLHISSSEGDYFYLVFIEKKDRKITLNPVTSEYEIICDEGCAEIYKKIK